MTRIEALEAALRRDRQVVIAALVLAIAASWLYLLVSAGMTMNSVDGAKPMAWTAGHAAMMLAMWWIMMLAMMLPSAAPMILMFAALQRRMAAGDPATTWIFASGYVVVWGGFSLLAVALQWRLERVALLSPAMVTTSVALGAGLLIAAGFWQLTPLKHACLRHCRSPVEFITTHWRPGRAGAFAIGLRHGLVCLGCCWLMMLLLFYGGVMNLTWVAALAAFALIEKLAPAGPWIGRATGAGMIAAGGALLIGAL